MFAAEIPKTFLGLKDEVSGGSEGGQGGWKKVIIGLNDGGEDILQNVTDPIALFWTKWLF